MLPLVLAVAPAPAGELDLYSVTRQLASAFPDSRQSSNGERQGRSTGPGTQQLMLADSRYAFRPVPEGGDLSAESASRLALGPDAVQTALFDTPPYPPDDRFTPAASAPTLADRQSDAEAESGLSPQRTRFYIGALVGGQGLLNTAFAPGLELSDYQLALSGLIGVNLGRYVSLEIAADFAEADLDAAGIGTIAEFSQFNLIPQLRLRYPFLNDRMTAYVTGGVGYGQTEVNDNTPASLAPGAPTFTGPDKDNSLVYAFGGGLEYYYADNIALSLEAKYTSQTAEIDLDGATNEVDLEAFRVLAGVRLLFPGPTFAPRSDGAAEESSIFGHDPRFARPYFTFQVGPPGAALLLEEDIDGTFSFGGRQGLVLGGGLGYDLNRYLGVELAANWHEHGIEAFRVDFDTDAAVVEYGIWTLIPQLRLKYPLMDDRLVPYMLAGAGLGYTETNDPADETAVLDISTVEADEYGFAAVLGAGLEYFVADNMAVGAEIKYIYHRPDLEIDGRAVEVNADSLLGTVGVRVYF